MEHNKKPNPQNEGTKKEIRRENRESKLTKEDLLALGPKDDNLHLDGGDDEQLLDRKRKVDFAAEDLDIPGSELDDRQEEIGSEDEENNSYSNADDERD